MGIFDYAPAPESRAIVDIKPSYGLFIDGEFTPASGDSFKSVNPATESSARCWRSVDTTVTRSAS